MRVIYPSAKEALLRGQIDLMTDTIKAQLVGAYTYNPTHVDTDDLTGLVGTALIVSVTDVANGVALCGDLVFDNLTGPAVTGIAFYHEVDVDTPGTLVSFTDQRGDTTPLAVTPNGGDVTFTFDFLLKI
jgi:hypothetical protein